MTRKIVPFRRVGGNADEMSDEGLVAACAIGENAALGALFDRHHEAVRRYLARLSGTDDSDLDDLVQATFEALPRAARRFDGRASGKTWLFGVASNIARHHVRTEIRRKRVIESAFSSTSGEVLDGSDDALRRERAERLHAAIVALPVKLREAFVLVYLEGVSGPEVARLVGAREGTIWKRLHQARVRLREALGGVYP